MNKDERYVTVDEAESITGRKASTWRRDIFERRIACVRFGRSVRIPLSEIERLAREGYRGPIAKNER